MKIGIYTLTETGEVPNFVIKGGYLAVFNGNASPQDFDLVGLVDDDAPGINFPTWNDLLAYATEHFGATVKDEEGIEYPVDILLSFATPVLGSGE